MSPASKVLTTFPANVFSVMAHIIGALYNAQCRSGPLITPLDFVDGMNEEFVRRYALAIDGEQDPRNLVIVFRMTVIVLQHFNLGKPIPFSAISRSIYSILSLPFYGVNNLWIFHFVDL